MVGCSLKIPSDIHVCGVITPSLVEYWLVLSNSIAAANGIEHYFWDPELVAESVFMEFGRSQADFHWVPGSSEDLLSIGFMRHSADFIPAHHHELHIAWPCFSLFTQQKGGGTVTIAHVYVDQSILQRGYQFKTWQFSSLDKIPQVGNFSIDGRRIAFPAAGYVLSCAFLCSVASFSKLLVH
jgi:hypothetical protein